MKKAHFFLIMILLFVSFQSHSQKIKHSRHSAYYFYVYQLSVEEVKEIFLDKKANISDPKYHENLLDSFYTDSMSLYLGKLKQGHYIIKTIQYNYEEYILKLVNNFIVTNHELKDQAGISVHSKEGKPITDAKLYYGKSLIPFNEKLQLYTFQKQKKNQTLFIEYNGIVEVRSIFFREDFNSNSPVLAKYRKNILSFGGRSINKSRGYIATNKPVYKHGDTLKFKAFILRNERKVNKSLQLNAYPNYSDIIYTDKIKPSERGIYQSEFIITDSFKLDQTHYLSLSKPIRKSWRAKRYVYNHFYIEDYQLNEIDYSAKVDDDLLEKNHLVYITATGKDANNQAVFGASAKLTLKVEFIQAIYDSFVYIPFTIWEHTMPFDVTGQAHFKVPDSLLPYAKLALSAKLSFTNANNEIQEQNVDFVYDKPIENIRFQEDGLKLKILYSHKESLIKSKKVNLRQYIAYMVESKSDSISIPCEIEINPFISEYKIEWGYNDMSQEMREIDPHVEISAYRTSDSFFIELVNPRKLDCIYKVYIGKEQILEDKSKAFSMARDYNGSLNIYILLEYVWAGESHEISKDLPLYTYNIQIESDIPKDVKPGDKVDIKIEVKDYKNEPLRNVNLTAYAINSQFYNSNLPNLNTAGYVIKEYPELYSPRLDRKSSNKSIKVSEKTRSRYNLDTMAYYNFRYPEKGYYAEYIPLKNRSAQFSPYVVYKGFITDVAMIYVDDTLVYFRKDYYKYRPYSFIIKPGIHKISLRTYNKFIELEGIEIKENTKLIFSVDLSNPPSFASIKKSKSKLHKKERDELSKQYLNIKFMDNGKYAYVFQENRIFRFDQIKYRNYYSSIPIGPFNPEKEIYLMTNYGFIIKHNLINGNRITIKDSMLTSDTTYYFSKYLSSYAEKAEISQYALEKSDMVLDTTLIVENDLRWAEFNKLQKDYGDFYYSESYIAVLAYRSGNYDTLYIYPGFNSILSKLHPGFYDFYFLSTYGNMASLKNVKIVTDSTFCIRSLTSISWDSTGINRLLAKFNHIKGQIPYAQLYLKEIAYSYQESASEKLVVKGRIIDKDSKSPLVHDEVEFKCWDGNSIKVSTDSNGYFQCTTLKAATYDIYFHNSSVLDNQFYTDFEVGCFELKPTTEYNFNIQLEKFKWLFNFPDYYIGGIDINNFELTNVNMACNYTTAGVNGYGRIGLGRRGFGLADMKFDRAYSVPDNIGFLEGVDLWDEEYEMCEEVVAYTGGIAAEYGDFSGGVLYMMYDSDLLRGNVFYDDINADNFNSGAYLAGRAINPNSLRSKFSDNAYWQPNLWTDENGEASFSVTFPDNITSWESHILAMDNKKRAGQATFITRSFLKMNATLANPRFLIVGDQATMAGKIQNNTNDSMQINYEFKVDDKSILSKKEKIFKSLVVECPLSSSSLTDSLELVFGANNSGNNSDGEKWFIPVYNKGVEENQGKVFVLENDTTVTFSYDPEKGPVYVYVQNDAADALQQSIDFLKAYEYGCNEQLASKLIAFLVDKQIKESKSQKFTEDQKIKSLINKLEKNKNDVDCWGWWNKSAINPWMSAYVINSLLYAQQNGFEIKNLENSLKNLLEDFSIYSISNQLFILKILSDYNLEIDFPKYMSQINNDKKSLSDQLMLQNLKSNLNMPIKTEFIFDNMKESQLGSVVVSPTDKSYENNAYNLSLLAYQSLKNTGDSNELLPKFSNYFLENGSNQGWGNTYQTAMILKSIVPDLLQETSTGLKSRVVIREIYSEAIVTFPMQHTIENGHGKIHIEKSGDLPIYATCYQKSWNENPIRIDKDFDVVSRFKKEYDQIDFLKAGELATLEVKLVTTKESDYVMIEVPIPAGCSYYKSNDSKNLNEVHREYYKHKVVIFCEKLPIGKHIFEISLQPRFTGTYTLNPAKAELMYFPTVFGREEMKELEIR